MQASLDSKWEEMAQVENPGGEDLAVLEAGGSPLILHIYLAFYCTLNTVVFWYQPITVKKSSPVLKGHPCQEEAL